MRGWVLSTVAGRCSGDTDHTFAAGDEVFVLAGLRWRKVYCWDCGMDRLGGAESGALPVGVTQPLPTLAAPHRGAGNANTGQSRSGDWARVGEIAARAAQPAPDHRMAAANDRATVAEDDSDIRFDPSDWE